MTEWLTENARRAYPLAGKASPKNRFNLREWAENPMSCRCAKYGRLTVDTAAGTVSLENNGTGIEVYTAYSLVAGGYYTMQQRGGVLYTLSAELGGTTTSSDIYMFFFDDTGAYLGGSAIVATAKAGDAISVSYVPPDGSSTAQIRFDTNRPGQVSVFSSVSVAETDVSDLVNASLLDACVGCDWLPDEGDIRLLDIRKTEEGVSFHIGSPDDAPDQSSRQVEVIVRTGQSGRISAYAAGPHVKAILTVSGQAVTAARDTLPDFNWHDVDTPFALRCCSYATKRVTAVEAYAPDDDHRCSRPVWPDGRNLVKTATGDVVLVSKDGVDADVTQMAPLEGDILRLSSVTAPLALRAADKPVDLMIRGDACVQVEAIPGMKVTSGGAIVPWRDPAAPKYTDEKSCGVIILTEKCKPCCQCEDYHDAAEDLRPGYRATYGIKDVLDRAKDEYDSALRAFNAIKAAAVERLHGLNRVIASATAIASGNVTTGVNSAGTRRRLSVTISAVNTVLATDELSGTVEVRGVNVSVPCPGSQCYVLTGVDWRSTGAYAASGNASALPIAPGAVLNPGDTLTVVVSYAMMATDSAAYKPSGITASITVGRVGETRSETLPVTVK